MMIFELNDIVFEWDDEKAKKVLQNHKIDFKEACTIFFDNFVTHQEDKRFDYEEERYLSIGMSNQARMIIVTWTFRDENIRLITAFKPSKKQLQIYGAK